MSWGKVLVGFVLILGVFIAWLRIMRSMRDGGGSGLDMSLSNGRKRNAGANELEQIIAAHRAGNGTAGSADVPVAALPLAIPQPATPAPPASPIPALLQAPVMLSGARKLAYLVFKAGVPDHHLFARVALGELLPVELAGADLGRHTFALVVCRPDFTVAAAVDIADPATVQRMALVDGTLQSASIRHIVLDPRQMPKPKDVRALLEHH
jgi:hypothetical protein